MRKIILLLTAVFCFSMTGMSKSKTITFHFIETTDVHGCYFPYDFINRMPNSGSLSRVSSYVGRMREKFGNNTFLFDNGDFIQGQPTCYFYNYIDTLNTNIASEVMNYLRYDAATIGNHDIETGHNVYDKWVEELNCPMLGANILNTRTDKTYFKPYTIFERDGLKIAVLGMITPAIPNWLAEELWSGMQFTEMVSTAKIWMKQIREKEKADIIIGLFHSGKEGGIVTNGYEEDAAVKVAKEVPGFDVVFFGHDHKEFCQTVCNTEGKNVMCLNPANNAHQIADAEVCVTIEGKGDKRTISKKIKGTLHNINEESNDEVFIEHFQSKIDKVKEYVGRKIGEFENTLYIRDSYFGSSAFNDFILSVELEVSKADIAFNAPCDYNTQIDKGDIYVSDLFKLYKFENQLYVMNLTGEEVRKHLEMSYDLWVNTMKTADDHLFQLDINSTDNQHGRFKNFFFNFDSAAGIDYEVDVTKPDGQKVKILKMSNGEAFDPKKTYKVVVNSYRGNGGGELLTKGAGIPKKELGKRIVWRSKMDQRYYLMKKIEKEGKLNPKPLNNWKFVPENIVRPAAERDYKLLF